MSNADLVRGDRGGAGRRFAALVTSMLAVSAAVALMAPGASAQGGPPGGFVTICHAAGQSGTTHYIELTIAYNAAYGEAGHFLEPGTPNAGHEDDLEGPCPEGTTDTGDTGTTDETGDTGTTDETGETGTTEAAAAPAPTGGGGELAFTGSSSLLIALGGAAMAGMGYALRRSLRSES